YLGRWKDVLGRYGIMEITKGHGGSDIGPLKPQGVVTIGLMPDSQRYFDYHHAETDTFDKINKRELELGGAAMASLIYIIAEFGWDSK
ncbi:MAG: peptidase M28 family protein, partial [Bacteroidia bacterium]